MNKPILEPTESTPEQTAPAAIPPARVPLSHRTWAKVTAFLLCAVLVIVTAASVFGIAAAMNYGLYTTPEPQMRQEVFDGAVLNDAWQLIHYLMDGQEDTADRLCACRNFSAVSIRSETLDWSWSSDKLAADYSFSRTLYFNPVSEEVWNGNYSGNCIPVTVTITLAKYMSVEDHYLLLDRIVTVGYALRYWIFVLCALSLLLTVACFVFLLCASGHHKGHAEVRPGWGARVPFDLLTAATAAAGFCVIWGSFDLFYNSSPLALALIFCTVPSLVLGWCMSFALRVKLGGWWKNTLVWYLLLLLGRALRLLSKALRLLGRVLRRTPALLKRFFRLLFTPFRWLGRGLKRLGRGFRSLLDRVPLIGGGLVCVGGALFLDFLIAISSFHNTDLMMILWILTRFFLLLFWLAVFLMLRRLQDAGEALAAGDLNHQIDAKNLYGPFKTHGENLNRIGEGMSMAVEQRIRSEHMKTELITNVSHDIKTPLTSLINYADLIEKEPCDNGKITEYAAVLHRQSERLKRLIDDLVELSKSTTGNMELNLAPCEAGVFLDQTVGEYEQRMTDRRLELIVRRPDRPMVIRADGRRLWRVMDNLMNNICKYAQGGTRVYVTLEEQDSNAVFTFKNTSRDPLDLTADELMERFVRGDVSRATEGSGLGLSIARSLTELQGGTLDLTVDGDLFKVILRFPLSK